jgi:RND family efflux transporter MFP subunit
MDDKTALLDQLRIDRSAPPLPSGGSRRWPALVIAALLVGGLAGWWLLRPAPLSVRVATARPAAAGSGSAAAPVSILDASGYVVARRQATVASKVTGKLVELDIEEGDHVKAGQVIARLDDSNARAALNQALAQRDFARTSLRETVVNIANARREFDRQNSLLDRHFVSQSAVDNARTALDALEAQLATQQSNVAVGERNVEAAERNVDDTTVRAPFAGVVTVKAAQPGEIVSPISAGGGFTRTGIGTIVDMDSLEVQVDVNENFINRVQPAQAASARLNAYPDWQIPAHVIAVIPTADRAKGTVQVRIGLDVRDARILPEMGVRVAFLDSAPTAGPTAASTAAASPGVLVPSAAVSATGSSGTVYVVVHGERIEQRAVHLGPVRGSDTTVLSGLSAGEQVALGDPARLHDGAAVTVTP